MKSFPFITNEHRMICFDSLLALYNSDKIKILQAAVRATSASRLPFVIATGTDIDTQIRTLRQRVERNSENHGLNLIAKLIEELYDDLTTNSAIGVTEADFLSKANFPFDRSRIEYQSAGIWSLTGKLDVNNNPRNIQIHIRKGRSASGAIVSLPIIHFIRQAIDAFHKKMYSVSLALMSIALEGTLRDALHVKGIGYNPGAPSTDVYEIREMNVYKDANGYRVDFPVTMPKIPADYLNAPGDPTYRTVKIKRVERNGKTILEIRDCDDLADYWSSDVVVTTGSPQVSGLGAALNIGRNRLRIITPIDLPPDLDRPIQAVRNNLIHFSDAALNETVIQDDNGNDVSLADFLKDDVRVQDTVCSICETINSIYTKIADGTL